MQTSSPYRRVGLTRTTYGQPSLHQVIKGKGEVHESVEPTSLSSTHFPSNFNNDNLESIYAQPESSEDESNSIQFKKPSSSPISVIDMPTKKRKSIAVTATSRSSRGTASKKVKLQDEPDAAVPPSFEPFDAFTSPSSQVKRRRRDYQTARNIHATSKGTSKGSDFATPALPYSLSKQDTIATFSIPTDIERQSPRRRTRNSLKAELTDFVPPPPAPNLKVEPESLFKNIPLPIGLSHHPESSSEPSSTLHDPIFDTPKLPTGVNAHRRSGSDTSSLSERSLSPSLELSQQRIRELEHDDTNDGMEGRRFVRCPYCSSRIDPTYLQSPVSVKHRLKIRQQQAFCFKHRAGRAKEEWQEKGYPDIQWNALEEKRVPELMQELTAVVNDYHSSFYRNQLQNAVTEARSSRKGLQFYLREGIVDIVKYGYYGPRGARVVGQALSNHISDELKTLMNKDKLARAAGFGGYVNAVLVPELIERLVMEDMHLDKQEKARQILADSSELGFLLNADEDEYFEQEDEYLV